jgi:tape measure domain-containing protein
MASSKKRVVFKIEGEYDNSPLRALKQDVDNLGKIDAFAKIRQDFAAASKVFSAAKENARALREQLKAGGGAEIASQYAAAKDTVKGLGKSLDQQRNALRANGEALRQAGVDTGALTAEQAKLAASIKAQKEVWNAYGKLAIRPLNEIKAEMIAVGAAVKTLRDQGVLRPEAIDAAKAKIKELRAEAGLISPALTAAKAAQEAYGTVGVRSLAAIKAEMQAVAAAVRTLRAQGPVDPRVIDAARAKMAELRAEAGSNKSAFSALDAVVSGAISKWSALLGGAGLGVFAKLAFDAGASAQSIKTAFEVIFGSAEAGAEELEFVRKTSKDLNLEFESTIKAYQQLAAASQGTALAGKPTRDIFVGISQASTVLGLSADETTGALKAVEQMMSKGKVQAEELRGQLGERLPGAFGLAAKAMGVTTAELDKMLNAGEVTAEDLLPKLAQALQDSFAGGVEKAKNNAVQSINALKNAWYDFRVAFAESGFLEFATGKIKDLSAALADPKVQQAARDIGKAVAEMGTGIYDFVKNNKDFLAVMGLVVTGLYGAEKAMEAYAAAAVLAKAGTLAAAPAFAKFAAGLALFALAYKGAEWLTMRKDLAALEESTALLAKTNKNLDKGLQELAKSTGVALASWEDFEEAQKTGLLVYNETTGAWEKGEVKKQEEVKKTAEASEEAAKKQKEKLDELKKEYKDLVKEIENVGDELTKLADEGAADQLKLANASRTPIEAWEAQKQAAIGLGPVLAAAAAAAKTLAAAGDIEGANKSYARAVELGKQMRDGFRELAREVKAEWTPAMEQSLDAVKEKAKAAGEQYKESFDAAKKAGEDLKKTTEQLADAESGLAAAQREAAREGMTAAEAYRDISSAQNDLEMASKAAKEAGDAAAASGNLEEAQYYYDLAIKKAQEARQAAGELNQEVKDGEEIIVSAEQARANASAADISARQAEIEAIKAKQAAEAQAQAEAKAAEDAAKAAEDAAKAEAEALAAEKEKIVKTEAEAAQEAAKLEAEARQQITEILKEQQELLKTLADQKNEEADFSLGDTFTEAGEQAKNLYELNQKIAEQLKIVADESAAGWQRSFAATEAAGLEAAAAVEAALNNAARDRTSTITTYVKEVQQNYSGGIAQRFRDGGIPVKFNPSAARVIRPGTILPGFGGQDRIPAMMRDGEGVLNPHAVRALSPAGFHDLNKLRFERVAARLQGMGRRQPKIATILPALRAGGGSLGVAAKKKTIRVVFEDKSSGMVASGTMNSNADLQKLLKMQKHQAVVSSR